METKLNEINVKLSRNQKENIFNAFNYRQRIRLWLKKDALHGNDTLLVPSKSFTWNVKDYKLDEESIERDIISERAIDQFLDHCFEVITSISNDGVKKFTAYVSPTVDESLEKARENNVEWILSLDYSFLTKSAVYPVFKNVGKLMEM